VLEGGAAYEAGLAPGDEIVAIDGFRATPKVLAWAARRTQPFRASVRRGHQHREVDLRARYVDEITGLRVTASFGAAGRALLGAKAESWAEGHAIPVAHYDNFHGTEPIH
jgi:hypothetical protein